MEQGLIGYNIEYERVEYYGTNNADRVAGFRGIVLGVNSYVLDGEPVCEAIVEQTFPFHDGSLDLVPIHKMRVLSHTQSKTPSVLRIIDKYTT